MSMDETSRQLTERKNGQRSAAMDAQIAGETGAAGAENPTPPGANSEVPELLNRSITRLDELSGRMAEIERHIASQRPDAERFAHEIGPIVLATRGLRDEISGHKDEMKKGLDSHRREVAATLKQVEAQIGQHRENIQNDIGQCDALITASSQMLKEGKGLLQQSMTVYTKSTQSIADVGLKAGKHVETTAQNAGRVLDEQTGRLKQNLGEMESTYYRMREWLITKTVVIAMMSAFVGALVGGLMIGLYTMRRIDAIAEVQRNSAKWEYLIERQNKKNPQAGESLNREVEQEMENQEREAARDANK